MQDIAVDMAAEIPDTLPVNTPSDRFAITATTVIPASTTEGLYSLKAATIEGGAIADATVNAPEGPVVATARPTIAKTNVPESGPFTVVATGSTPSLGFQQEGWATVNVGNIRLVVTPKDAAGNATALGTLQVQCYQKPGQVNALAQFYIGTTPTPKPSAANITTAQKDNYATKTLTSRKSSVELLYDCQNLPIVLTQRFKVKATLDYPAEIPVNTYAPRIKIDSLTTINENTTEGLNSVSATSLDGSAIAQSTLTVPQLATPVGVQVKLPINKTPIPQWTSARGRRSTCRPTVKPPPWSSPSPAPRRSRSATSASR